MNTFDFTDRVRKVLQIAREEAFRRSHRHVGTEHILLGMMVEGQGVGAAALIDLAVDFDAVRAEIGNRMRQGDKPPEPPDLPYDASATRMFELSMSEAKDLKHSFVGTEHLLLGIIGEGKGIGAQVLSAAGVTIDAARREVRLLNGEGFDEIS